VSSGLLADAMSRHFLCALGVVEVHSVFARLVRMGQTSAADFHLVCGRFLADIASGLWQVFQVTGTDFQQAQQLLVRYGPTRGLRTLDGRRSLADPIDELVHADRVREVGRKMSSLHTVPRMRGVQVSQVEHAGIQRGWRSEMVAGRHGDRKQDARTILCALNLVVLAGTPS